MFLFDKTNWKSRREEGNSEILCAITSIPIVLVGLWFNDEVITFTGLMSMVSHAFPYKCFHLLDLLGCGLLGLKVLVNIRVILQNPVVVKWGVAAVLLNATDTYINRQEKKHYVLHCVWHLFAARFLWRLSNIL